MKVVVNLEKKYFYVLFGVLIIILGLLAINAYTSDLNAGSNPSVFGHSANEVMVQIGANQKTLQAAINSNDFNKSIISGQCTGTGSGWTGLPVHYYVSTKDAIGQKSLPECSGTTITVSTFGGDVNTREINMGKHKFCALNYFQISDSDNSWGNPGCRIWWDGTNWQLIAIANLIYNGQPVSNIKHAFCAAYCLD